MEGHRGNGLADSGGGASGGQEESFGVTDQIDAVRHSQIIPV